MPVTTNVQLIKPLGAGGMGAVWLADHTALKTRVVVKFMLGGLDANVSAVKRFKREAEAAAQVKSPHVVQMLDHGVTEDGIPFIVMEHLEGRDLGVVLQQANGPLDARRVITIVTQVAKALTKVHGAGLLHRDIKPDNIFLCDGEDDDFVKLLDFGIAKSAEAQQREDATLDGETKTGQVVGTPFYMSPEQVTAQKVIDARSDLWALGVVTFEALTGVRPFDGPSFGALAVKIATGTPPKPSEHNPALPPSVDAWFAKACAREPGQRFRTAREMAEALRASFDGYVSLPPSGGAMSDSSGERRVPTPSPSEPSTSKRAPTPTELAATVNQPTPDPSDPAAANVLARSEGGGAVVVDERGEGKRGVGKIVVAGVALAALAAAFTLGMRSGPSTPTNGVGAPPPASATAEAKNVRPSAEPSASAPPPVVSASAPPPATASAPASASAPAPSIAPVTAHPATAQKPAGTPSTKPAASASAPPVNVVNVGTKPEPSAKPAVKPSPTGEPDLY